jgi:hypothetical protein
MKILWAGIQGYVKNIWEDLFFGPELEVELWTKIIIFQRTFSPKTILKEQFNEHIYVMLQHIYKGKTSFKTLQLTIVLLYQIKQI